MEECVKERGDDSVGEGVRERGKCVREREGKVWERE